MLLVLFTLVISNVDIFTVTSSENIVILQSFRVSFTPSNFERMFSILTGTIYYN